MKTEFTLYVKMEVHHNGLTREDIHYTLEDLIECGIHEIFTYNIGPNKPLTNYDVCAMSVVIDSHEEKKLTAEEKLVNAIKLALNCDDSAAADDILLHALKENQNNS